MRRAHPVAAGPPRLPPVPDGARHRDAARASSGTGGRSRGADFDTGIQLALERLLVDPDFLLRVQEDPPGAAPGEVYALSDLELASRLSFFLWSSIPDDELLDVAERGELTDPATLRGQVRRMLADPRREALVSDFAAQWLHLRNLDEVKAEPSVYPDFDQDLVEAFRRETALFIAEHHRRGPERPRPPRGRLHLRERAAGAALRHPRRLREPVPARDAARSGAAGRVAGPRVAVVADLLPAPDLGPSCGGGGCWRPFSGRRRRVRRPTCRRCPSAGRTPRRRRCASAWSCTGAIPPARVATG